MFAAGAAALALALGPATDAGRVGLGSQFGPIVVGQDGGAWVPVDRFFLALDRGRGTAENAVARATPDGGFTVSPVEGGLGEGAIGPDGQAWFHAGQTLARVDAAGTVTKQELERPLGDVLGSGPDGTLWTASSRARTLSRVDAQGMATGSPLRVPRCTPLAEYRDLAVAGDGAVWLADGFCERVIRVAPGAAPAVFALGERERFVELAPDRTGGMWFSSHTVGDQVGHIDAAGHVRRWKTPKRVPSGIATAPDGTAYVAFGNCRLGRIAPDGTLTYADAPTPARDLAFTPSGGIWLASATRLVHLPATTALTRGTCDDEPPALELSPSLRRSVSLRALRRGIRIGVREPALVSATGDYGQDDHDFQLRIVRSARGGALTFRVPRAALRRFARELGAGRRPELLLYAEAEDREGNTATVEHDVVRVVR